ncbi:MAG: NUDIX hydrolase [Caldilineaceae bacterium]|nr:NUDIX hydrolase [Caldilineaceae bacterium]
MAKRNKKMTLEPWTTLSTSEAFSNRWTGVLVDEVELPNGERYEYTRLRPAGIGVAIIGFDEKGRILLEKEYRHGVGEIVWQLPGGLADGSETLRDAGLRELREETGYAPALINDRTVRYLGSIWDNPALGDSQSHIFAAYNLEQNEEIARDPAEAISLHWQRPYWLKEAIRSGIVRDRVLVAAAAYLMIDGLL